MDEKSDWRVAENRLNWDDRAQVHATSPFYEVERLVVDRSYVSPVARRDYDVLRPHLGPNGLAGRSLLHLQLLMHAVLKSRCSSGPFLIAHQHICTRPYSPWQNGKVERMNRTPAQERQRGRAQDGEAERADALSAVVEPYNWNRPHSACGGQPPMSRIVGVNNLLAHNS